MHTPTFVITDRTDATGAIDFVLAKLTGYDMHLLDWMRINPMTERQHQRPPGSEYPPVTLSTCWTPREANLEADPPLKRNMYRIKVNVWQGADYPAAEMDWGRIPPRPIWRRSLAERYTTRGLCKWSYPDRLTATVHALARPLFLYLASTKQVAQNPSASNASAWGHRWAAEWLRSHGRQDDAEAMVSQLMQWTLIQSKGWLE
jgi:hypothetical protein